MIRLLITLFLITIVPVYAEFVHLDNGYKIWVEKVGTGTPILILNGGPGTPHDYLKILGDYLPGQGFQVIFYDQLGTGKSDNPNNPALWTLPRYVDEVEQVRKALHLEDFYLYGHSWGGLLAIEYALQYQQHLRGLIISNMTASIPSYLCSLEKIRLSLPKDLQAALTYYESRGEFHHPEYKKLMEQEVYRRVMSRLDPFPEFLRKAFDATNIQIYETMQGPNEFVVTGNLKDWDRWSDLNKITIPTLLIGARYDTMDPDDIIKMARLMPRGEFFISSKGSHIAMYDDSQAYLFQLISFLQRLEYARLVK